MTQYISSFLIDPVVRQARRFSRPGHDVDFVSDNHLDAVGEQSSPSHTGTRALPEEGHGMTSLNDTDSQLYVHPIYSQAIRPNEQVRMNVEHNGYGNEVARPLPEEPTRARAGTDPSRRASVTSNAHQISHSRFGSVNASFPSSIHDTSHRFAEGSELRRRGTDQSNISQMSVDSNHTTLASGLLPENDGMGVMRQKIRRIQNLDASNAEKSRLMHAVMMEQYSSSHMNFHTSQGLRPLSPASLRSQERPFTPSSSHSFQEHGASGSPLTSLSSAPDTEHYLTPDDLKITYYTHSHQTLDPESKPTDLPPNPTQTAALDDSGKPVLGCEHYKRNVKLQCSACYRWYTCRFCHDTVEDHSLNRRETKNMLCMPCGTAQPAAEICRNCGEISAWYYCGICKLWDNDPTKRIYHCDDCGICRIGEGLGKDYYHCKTCGVCLSISIRDTHRCIERSTDCDCPICGEYMFNSLQTVVFMRCGHSIHRTCYNKHMENSFKCPICSRSLVNMEMTFNRLDHDIESQPMPPQFRDTKALIYCNDCNAKTQVKYHWLGLKCIVCDSYNTVQLQLLTDQPAALEEQMNEEIAGLEVTSNNLDVPMTDSMAITRGRSLTIAQARRVAISAPDLDSITNPQHHLALNRRTQSNSTSAMNRIVFPSSDQSDSTDADPMDTDSDDDVDFWGGESPRDRALHASRPAPVEPGEESGDSSDEDENMEDDFEDDDDDDIDDPLQLFGHR